MLLIVSVAFAIIVSRELVAPRPGASRPGQTPPVLSHRLFHGDFVRRDLAAHQVTIFGMARCLEIASASEPPAAAAP
ncbi:hypothetical protein ACTZWT_00580 [Rhodopseudomonas sp. NSM]|uniref:hypothetical protein n=1 Tax=Rhodopseudomonas sp. NSM TaxID=3457630 RepID=UPI004036CBC7